MREIVLDTETTGLDPLAGHRVVEVGCIELVNTVATGKGSLLEIQVDARNFVRLTASSVLRIVTLRDEGVLPERPWFLIELDSPAYGSGVQVAPSTVANYDALVAPMRQHFSVSRWAVHGQGVAGYAVLERALVDGGTSVSVSRMPSTCRMAASRGAMPSW